MIVKAIKTHKITPYKDTDLIKIIDSYIKVIKENSIVVIASKIIAITQGRVVKMSDEELEAFIKKEADLYIPKEEHKYKLFITLVQNRLTYSSGIDESNGGGYQILWPENPQNVANLVRRHIKEKYKIKNVGVIITDMTALPLRWGVIAGEIAYSGFKPLKNLIGSSDIFGKKFKYTKVGVLNGLAASAGVVMGEGSEQTPLGIITDIPFVEFVDKNPTQKELKELIIEPENDLYGPLFKNVKWKRGDKK